MKTLSPASAALIRALGGLLTPGGSRASLLVLIFHRVLDRRDPLLQGEPDAHEFATQLDVIRSVCRVLPLDEAVDRLRSGSLPQRSVCITFDDGYANNRTTAAPLLKERGMPATVFVATGYLNGGRMFNDTVIESVRRAGPELDCVTWASSVSSSPTMPRACTRSTRFSACSSTGRLRSAWREQKR
jgi:hypothetical protein